MESGGQRLIAEVILPWQSGLLCFGRRKMVSEETKLELLKALRERLEPLFERYAYLDYLTLFRAVDEESGPYSTTIKPCFDGVETPIDFSSREWYEPAPHNKELIQFYRHYTKLRIGWNNQLAGDLLKLGSVVIHREPDQCRRKTEKY